MSHSGLNELIRAEKLIEEGKIDKALKLINEFGEKKDLLQYEWISYYTAKSRIATYFWDRYECNKYAEEAYRESQKLENSLLLLDVYMQMATSSNFFHKTKETSKFIKMSEDLLQTLPQDLSTELRKRNAYILWIKAYNYNWKGKFEKAIRYAKQALVLRQELQINADIALSFYQLGQISWVRGDLNHALEYIESCKIIANNLNLINILHRSDAQLGIIYSMKGDLDRALSYNEQVLAFAKKNNDLEIISNIYNNIGQIYQEKGDFDRALEYLEKSIRIKEKIGPNLAIFIVTDSLFHLALDMNDLGQAQRYLNRMKQINDQEKDQNIIINQGYNLDRAIYLKNSPLALNRGKAEELLKQLVEKGIQDYELLSKALLNLCDLLLYDLRMTNELEILDELQFYISQLFETIKKSRSFSLLAETYLLQARLTLLNLDLIRTQQFLTKAQEIAENYGLNRLAIKISNEHDEFLKRLDMWDKLKTSKVSLSERLELVHPNEQMKRMIQKREIVVPEVSDEKPVLLLIISEGGNPIFSQSFTKQQLFEDHLFGGFLFAINSFISEKFSKGLDRATFGEYTLLMKAISPFFVCYIFKGQSYLAQKRINFFIESLKENKDTWHTFRDFHYLNKEIQIKDIPSLEPMITKIFINKSVSLIV